MITVAKESGNSVYRSALTLGPFEVIIESEIPGAIQEVADIYSAAPTPAPTGEGDYPTTETVIYRVCYETEQTRDSPRFLITRNDEILRRNTRQEDLSRFLEWSITDTASRALTGYHRIHAGAIAYNGHGILMPAISGSGKSTTVAALALNGLDYCSDEMALIGADSRLRPFPKIISLKSGGWREIYRQFPDLVAERGWPNVSGGGAWQVKPPVLPDAEQSRAGYPIDLVLLPKHSTEEATSLKPISKSEALRDLVDQSMDLKLWGSTGLDMLVKVVQQAECYALCSNRLADSVALVQELAS
ncbi:MAG: hypothetical protein ACE5Q6_10280 [Dehalococcoidia bacterium]